MLTFKGCLHGVAELGGENLTGGDLAKGIPRYLLTAEVAAGKAVVVPMMTPSAITATGFPGPQGNPVDARTTLACSNISRADVKLFPSFMLKIVQSNMSFRGTP